MQVLSSAAVQTLDRADIPEIAGTNVHVPATAATFRDYGTFVVRDFFPAEDVAALQLIARLSFGMGDAIVANCPAAMLPNELSDGLAVRGWIAWPRIVGLLEASATNLPAQAAKILERIRDLAASCYGREAKVIENFNVIRRHRTNRATGEATNLPWHRDFTFTSLAGHNESLNCWVPCVEVGERSPSLEVIPRSHSYMADKPDQEPGITQISESWVDAHLGDLKRCAPRCKPGDVIVFDHHVIHRTQRISFSEDRLSFELRCAPAASA